MRVNEDRLRTKRNPNKDILNQKNYKFNDTRLPVNFKINIKKSKEDLLIEKLLKITGKTKEELKTFIERL